MGDEGRGITETKTENPLLLQVIRSAYRHRAFRCTLELQCEQTGSAVIHHLQTWR